MSTRIILAATLFAFAAPPSAETPNANAEPALGMEPGATQPMMDQTIFAHAIFNQLEGRWNGSNPEFRWDGQGWVGTDYDKLWIKSEGTLQSNGTTYFDLQAACVATSIHGRRATGVPSASRVSPLISSISRLPVS